MHRATEAAQPRPGNSPGYRLVLAALVSLAALYPILGFGIPGLAVWTAAFWLLLLALSRALQPQRFTRLALRTTHVVAAASAVLAVACHAFRAEGHGWIFVSVNGIILAYLVATTVGVARHVFGAGTVSRDALWGAACVYVLLGLTWTYVYHVLHGLGLTAALATPGTELDPALRHAEYLYFSFVTLSTVGYGDIAPDTLILRVTAASEAITGQIFLTIVVARVVGLHIAGGERGQ